MRIRSPKQPPPSSHVQTKPWQPKDEWYVAKYTSPAKMQVYLVNDYLMDRKQKDDGVELSKAILFGEVSHSDPDFERKWAIVLSKARRRIEVLGKGVQFTLDEVETAIDDGDSLCGNCGKEFDGEDYLCPDCRE